MRHPDRPASSLTPRAVVISLLSVFVGACSAGEAGSVDEPRQTVLLSEFSYGGDTDAYLHLLDGRDLSPISRIAALDPHTGVQPVPGGERLLAAEGISSGPSGCCALYLLDLAAGTRCQLHSPLADYVPSADGRLAYSQRGNTPISIFDLESATRVDTLAADANTFALNPSPDGRWLAAASRFSLDDQHGIRFFDAATHEIAGSSAHDLDSLTWHDGLLYGLHLGDDGWHLRSLTPPEGDLVADRSLETIGPPPATHAGLALGSAGEVLFLHLAISNWMKFQSRKDIGPDAPGGIFVLDPDTAKVQRHLLPQHDIGMVAASDDGSTLYALISKHDAPHLFAIETATGRILAERDLLEVGPGRWSLSAAELQPSALAVTGDRRLGTCPSQQAKRED